MPEPETVDGRYELRAKLGAGGMGSVYEAFDIHLHRRVAIKLLGEAKGPEDIERAASEARALASVRHRGVPTVHAFGQHGLQPFFVMELIEGSPLRDVIVDHAEHGHSIPLHRAVAIALDLSSALGAAHAAGVLHCDVKSENALIEAETGRTVLVDFGISTRRDQAETPGPVGTPQVMAPELWMGAPASIASDVYSLGCLLFELLSGRSAFEEKDVARLREAHSTRPPYALGELDAELAPFDPVVARALAKAPRDRFPTCAAFRASLEHVRTAPGDHSDVTMLLPASDDAVRILVVDDDAVFARVVKRAAQSAFHETLVAVAKATTGDAAVASAAQHMPHLLLLDYHLPGMNGAEVLSRIRSLPGGESVAVVVLSGAIGSDDWWRFSSLGVRSHVQKPARFDVLVNAILQKARSRGWLANVDRERPTPGLPLHPASGHESG